MSDIIKQKHLKGEEKILWATKSAVWEALLVSLHSSDKATNYPSSLFCIPRTAVGGGSAEPPKPPSPQLPPALAGQEMHFLWEGWYIHRFLLLSKFSRIFSTHNLNRNTERKKHKPMSVNSQGWLEAFTKHTVLARTSSCWADKLSAVLTDRLPHRKGLRNKQLDKTAIRKLMLILEKGVWIIRLCKMQSY